MPNWVDNTLEFRGTEEEMDELKLILDDSPNGNPVLSFSTTIPLPEGKEDDWYEWNIANWGTKWDACEPNLFDEGKLKEGVFYLKYSFNSAWASPQNWLIKTSEKYPSLLLNCLWVEEQGFSGVIRVKAGKIILSDSRDCPEMSEVDEGEDVFESYTEACYDFPNHWSNF